MNPGLAALASAPVAAPATPLRVLHVGKYYPPVPGGMERVLQLLCEGERRHVDSRVLVASAGRATERAVINGVPVTRLGSLSRIGSVALTPAMPLELLRTDADITVIHEPNPVALVADAVTRRRGPLVVYLHSEVVRPQWKYRLLYRPFLARVLDRADRIIVASPAMTEAAQLHGYRHKCRVIPYGIEPRRLQRTPAVEARARELRAEAGGVPLFLFVGRLVPYKGVDVLVDAMASVDAKVVVVGDGPMRRPLQARARDRGVSHRIDFRGAVSEEDLVAFYHASDGLVLPSVTRAEAFGMVQIEAMACGRPVVSTNLPSGVPWVNRHGETGLVVPPGDARALGRALGRLVDDEALRRRLGEGGRRRVEEEFTAARMAERTVALYHSVLGERPA